MLVKYLIPEDGDEASHPNVFSIGNVQSPTLGQIKKLFPIPGKYHYRYMKNIGNMTVWMDAIDDAFAIPPFEGKIFLKASRISESVQNPTSNAPRQQQQQPQQQQQIPSKSSTPTATRITIPKPPSSSETLLAFGSDDNDNDSQKIGASFMDSSDLIGLGSESSNSNIPKSSSNLDMFGIDSLQPTLMPMTAPMSTSYSSGSSNQIQQDSRLGRSMGMGSGVINPGHPPPIRGISPHPMPMVDAFSGLGSQQQQQNSRQMPQQPRRQY